MPKLIIFENFNPMSMPLSTIDTSIAPLWEIKAMFPLSGKTAEKEAFIGVAVSIMPTQLGPSMFMLCFLATCVIFFSSSNPLLPISLKPAVSTIKFLMFNSAASDTISKQYFAGIAMIAVSIGLPMLFKDS